MDDATCVFVETQSLSTYSNADSVYLFLSCTHVIEPFLKVSTQFPRPGASSMRTGFNFMYFMRPSALLYIIKRPSVRQTMTSQVPKRNIHPYRFSLGARSHVSSPSSRCHQQTQPASRASISVATLPFALFFATTLRIRSLGFDM